MSCILCNSDNSKVISERDRHNQPLVTRLCMGCGLVYNDPIPSDDELTEFYSEHYRKSYKGAAKPRRRQILRNFKRVADHVNVYSEIFSGVESVLDIGAGSGEFLFAMNAAGKRTKGIEPNRDYAAYCRDDLGLDVRTDEIKPGMFDGEKFDFIRLSHVLEHLNDPVEKLSAIAGCLKDDGVLYIEVPNIEGYASFRSTGRIFHYGHIFNFNPWTLRAGAGLAGLQEDERTAARTGGDTVVFLRKGPVWSAEKAGNPDNAARVESLLDAHYAGGSGAKPASRLLQKIRLRTSETVHGWMYRTPQAIGRAVLAKHMKLG
jgi:SAM-dependent methyltransferase